MNQEQRKFLIDQVNKTHQAQRTKLEEKIPNPPSLNNYLVAAFLDNTIQLRDIGPLQEKIKQHVLKFGKDDLLIEEDEDRHFYHRRRNSEKKDSFVKIKAEDIFIIPQNYLDALKEYEEAKARVEQEIEQLDAHHKTITMKIQIGSAAQLDKIVSQVDNMGDLNLFNNQFLLTNYKK
jgi:hypothetical protein